MKTAASAWLLAHQLSPPQEPAGAPPASPPLPAGFEEPPGQQRIPAAGALLLPPLLRHRATGIELVLIPPGTFWMGAGTGEEGAGEVEYPRHPVRIREPFYLGRHEVTNAQYRKFLPDHRPPPLEGHDFGGDDQPAVFVSWLQAGAFCSHHGLRLPSEAEWEYACRAGTRSRYSFGDDEKLLGEHAWYDRNSDGRTHPVGRKRPNPFGLYDMHGNAGEWTADGWHESYEGAPDDGRPWPSGDGWRIVRGFAWKSEAAWLSCASRAAGESTLAHHAVGFRAALSWPPPRVEAPGPKGGGKDRERGAWRPPDGFAAIPEAGLVRVRLLAAEVEVPAALRHRETGIELVLIPAGSFFMGAQAKEKGSTDRERPRHHVAIPEPFYLGRCEVTNGQFRRFDPDHDSGQEFDGDGQPAVRVSWRDAQRFCRWHGLRLPSEAEWEYACRAWSTTRFSCGDLDSDLFGHAWFDRNSGGRTHPVGQNKPNAFGLYDMHGNAAELCEDNLVQDYTATPRKGGAMLTGSATRVCRGGGWSHGADACRSASRRGEVESGGTPSLGFRVARSLR